MESGSGLLNIGPAIRREVEPVDAQGRRSIIVAVIIVIDECGERLGAVCAGVGKDALSAWTDNVSVLAQQDGASIRERAKLWGGLVSWDEMDNQAGG